MNVRIQFPRGRLVRRLPGKNRQTALAVSALLIPVALMAYALGFWRLADDMGMAEEFGFTGLLSHWQVWIGLGIGLHIGSRALSRCADGREVKVPRVLTVFPPPPDEQPPPAVTEERKRA